MARRISRSSCTPLPSSVNIVTPASASSAMGASGSPPRPTVMAADGMHVAARASSAVAATQSTTSTQSMVGSVLGMATR